jgi:hypothetical protein
MTRSRDRVEATMDADRLIAALSPLTRYVSRLDLSDPSTAMADLDQTFPLDQIGRLRRAIETAHATGELTPRKATETLSFGRLAKPGPATHGLSIDVVDMEGAGAGHTHPNGEVSLCFATSGDARFVGHPEGWVVVPPGSHHIPEVTGGRMLIVYFLPDGAMEWDPPSS